MFPDRLPTVREIDRARIPLRQATEIAIIIEAIDGYSSEDHLRLQARQFMTNLEYAANCLGYELKRPGSVPAIEDTEITMGR